MRYHRPMLVRSVWVPLLLCAATAAADPVAEPCAALAHEFELQPRATTELQLGDCYTQLGQPDQAARWYRDAARRALLASEQAAAPAPTPPAPTNWKAIAWTTVGVTALGFAGYAYGVHELNDAESQLCAGGAYATNPSCTVPQKPLSFAQVEQLNTQGGRGKVIADFGLSTGLIAGGIAGYALYRAYFAHDRDEHVVVAPMVAPGEGGAQLRVQW